VPFGELDELTHAYAVSIHRSQGSGYPCVVIPITTSAWMMLQRNLLYTAVTRAKKLVVLVGSTKPSVKPSAPSAPDAVTPPWTTGSATNSPGYRPRDPASDTPIRPDLPRCSPSFIARATAVPPMHLC
jgi:hypothetical protein